MPYPWREELDYCLAWGDFRGALQLAEYALEAEPLEPGQLEQLEALRGQLLARLSQDNRQQRLSPEERELVRQRLSELFQRELADGPDPQELSDPEDLEAVLAELEGMIGMEELKSQVHSLVHLLEIQGRRAQAGAKTPTASHHLVFRGAPGTGKTTVARLFGRIYHALGVLPSNRVTEVSREDLVAGFVGQTAIKTRKVLERARGGVLFIDEAYSLFAGSDNDFGYEAVAEILRAMEDQREQLVVIVAGYPEEMDRFVHSNPGLESRFVHHIDFQDYTPQQLAAIFRLMAAEYDYQLSPQAQQQLEAVMTQAAADSTERFGNGRFARNLLEGAMRAQATRLMQNQEEISDQQLSQLEAEDIHYRARACTQPLGFR